MATAGIAILAVGAMLAGIVPLLVGRDIGTWHACLGKEMAVFAMAILGAAAMIGISAITMLGACI